VIINGGDANKYSRDAKAFYYLMQIMKEIKKTIQHGETRTTYHFNNTIEAETVSQIGEWLREKNYDVEKSECYIRVDWSNK
jgi:hypothetical protein